MNLIRASIAFACAAAAAAATTTSFCTASTHEDDYDHDDNAPSWMYLEMKQVDPRIALSSGCWSTYGSHRLKD